MPTFLLYRGPHPYFKRAVPNDLQAALGRTAVWKRLRPTPGMSAEALARAEAVTLDREFARLRREHAATDAVSEFKPYHVARVCARYHALVLATDAESRAGLAAADRAQYRDLLDTALEQGSNALAFSDTDAIAETAETLLAAEGLRYPVNPELWRRLLLALLAQDVETARAQVALARGEAAALPPIPAPAKAPARLLDLVPAWERHNAPVEKTVWETKTTIKRFEAVCGALAVGEITQANAKTFRDHLIDNDGLARKTVRTYLGFLRTLIGFSMAEGAIQLTSNPFADVRVGKLAAAAHRRKRRRSFTPAELTVLFRSTIYTAGARPRARMGEAAFWLPLLGLLTGARLEELAQLQFADIRTVDNVPFIAIHASDDEHRVKNGGSWRLVPLHPQLVAIGFLQYVAGAAGGEGEGGRLFPTLVPDRHGKLGFEFSKWFGRWLDRLGLSDPNLDFHSFRSTFKDLCRLAEIPEDVHDALTGHVAQGREVSRGYGSAQYPAPPLVRAMQRIVVPDVDLSHLQRSRT
jgi:integrase